MTPLLLATALLYFAASQAVDEARAFGVVIGRAQACDIDRGKWRAYQGRVEDYLDTIVIDETDRADADAGLDEGIAIGRADQRENQTYSCTSVEFDLEQ